MTEWRPFGMTEVEAVEYEVLVPGVPEWLRVGIIRWTGDRLSHQNSRQLVFVDRLVALRTKIRLDLGDGAVGGGEYYVGRSNLEAKLAGLSDLELLRVVDYLLSLEWSGSTAVTSMERLLTDSRSRWMVGERDGHPGLVERVAQGAQDAVEGTIASSGEAGQLLARAWARVHGLEANDSGAYSDAVKAVETAAKPLVTPNDGSATLGKVIGQMRADGDWTLPLEEHTQNPTSAVLLNMLQALWTGQDDRHGGPNYADVRHEEARTAVMLAATLVEWFTSGSVARRP